jgi:hypothetical protein
MDEKAYPFLQGRTDFRYEFWSISSQKQVKKVVVFSQIDDEYFYNLALLDELENGELSDMTETNNSDLITVMATVFQIIDDFLSKNNGVFVLFRGSDEKRQRLYRIIISRELPKIQGKFKILAGVGNNDITIFESNKDYDYFLIKKI